MTLHPNAKSVWTTIEMDGSELKTVLVIETDLTLNAQAPDYDQNKVDSLIDAAGKHFQAHQNVLDRIRIVPIKQDSDG